MYVYGGEGGGGDALVVIYSTPLCIWGIGLVRFEIPM